MSIGKKLLVGFAVVLTLTAVVGGIGIYDVNEVAKTYQGDIAEKNHTMRQADLMLVDLLQVRRSEKDFIMRKDLKYADRVNKNLDAAEHKAEYVVEHAHSDEIKSKAHQFLVEEENYRTFFNKMVAEMKAKGLDEKGGIYGEFRAAAHNMEKVLKDNNFQQGEVLYLTIRRHEKDYMLRGAEKYMEKADKAIAALTNLVKGSSLAEGAKSSIYAHLQNYEKSFDQLVAKDKEIATLIPKIKIAADSGMSIAEEIEGIVATSEEALQAEVAASVTHTEYLLSGVVAICILIGSVFAFFLSRSITRPLNKTVDMILAIGSGELSKRLDISDRKDEIGVLAKELNGFADNLQDEVLAAFEKLADGDLTFEAHGVIREPLQKTNAALNEVMGQIQVAGEQIASGSGQVASASQSLSQGATEQASSLEEISASLNEMASQTGMSAENANSANKLASDVQDAAQKGSAQMQSMVEAMTEINDAGQNISKIIKTIDEIAFQTNLLALNAAVEAARAGQHGKGFAVVAEEVRNLAARSAKAAAETAELIEGSVDKTQNGSNIANQTAAALEEIVGGITQVSDLVGEIAAASNEQAQGISQVNQGVSQIDTVTQQNTANAEESAAASEELSGQAEQLRNMLSRFTLASTTGEAVSQFVSAKPTTTIGWANLEQDISSSAAQPQIALDDSEFGRF